MKKQTHEGQCEEIAAKGNAKAHSVMEELRQVAEEEEQWQE